MKDALFLFEMARIVNNAIECSSNPRLKSEVHLIGNFNYRVFNPYKMFRQTASGFVRFLMNLAMGMSEAEFRRMMISLTDRIVDAVESDECDVINTKHSHR